ncbi:MAG: hypothetical protein HZA20_12915 [Nitrospirae bacterium]|nr:hypothetical protein [Nitrospirota bacterium]
MEGNSVFQLVLYLVIPVMLGYEFLLCAKDEKAGKDEATMGSIMLDFFGILFIGLIPAIFIFTLWAVNSRFLPLQTDTIHFLQRYGVFFMFLGAWWQVYIFAAVRARRVRKNGLPSKSLWLPYALLGAFASLVVAWNFPWHLDLISVAWFMVIAGMINFIGFKPMNVERVFWMLALFTFIAENILFVWFNAIV